MAMAEKFDPYRKWLGIPPAEQPPNHYRLLGIGLFESDPDVVSNAADRQMVHVRSYQSGKHSALSQKILNELSAARVCLLDPKKKAEYDEQLRREFAAKTMEMGGMSIGVPTMPISVPTAPLVAPFPSQPVAPPPPPPPGAVLPPAVPPAPQVPSAPAIYATKPSRSLSTTYLPKRNKSTWQGPAITLALLAALAGIIAFGLSGTGGHSDSKKAGPKVIKRHAKQTELPAEPARDEEKNRQSSRPRHKESKPRPSDLGAGNAPASTPSTNLASEMNDPVGAIRRFDGHQGRVTALSFSPDGLLLLSGGDDKTVRVWDVESGADLRHFEGPTRPVTGVAFSPTGVLAAATSGEISPPGAGEMHLWNAAGGPANARVDLASLQLAADLCFSPKGDQIAVAGRDKTLRLWDATKATEVRIFSGHSAPVTCALFSFDGLNLLSGSEDQSVRLWSVPTGKQQQQFIGHADQVTGLAWCADGRSFLSAGRDKVLILWSLDSGKEVRRFVGNRASLLCVACSFDGKHALSGGEDGVVRVWKVATGEELHRFEGHQGPVLRVAFSPSGRRAVSCGADGTIRLWGLGDPSALVAQTAPQEPTTLLDTLQTQKHAPPAADDLKKAQDLVQSKLLKEAFAAADRPSKKESLLQALFNKTKDVQDDDVTTFALLTLARDLALELDNLDKALSAIDQLGQKYAIDALAMKIGALNTAAQSKSALVTANRLRLVERTFALADEAVAGDKFDVAEQLMVTARGIAKGLRDGGATLKLITARTKQIEELKQAQEPLKQAQARLEASREDPQANEIVGKYLCFKKGDWAAGLPKLAKASTPDLKLLAGNELANPQEPVQQLAIADSWWSLSEGETGRAQQQMRNHAAKWYQIAELKLTGENQDRARARLLEAGDANALVETAPLPPVEGFEGRREPVKASLLAALGGNEASEAAVERALEWLAQQQARDGSWSFNHRSPRRKGLSRNPGALAQSPNTATALALLPLLGAGHSPRGQGKYRSQVFTALEYLKEHSTTVRPKVATLFEKDAKQMPSHALGTMALCEAAAESRDKKLEATAQSLVAFIVESQNKDGGWSAEPSLLNSTDKEPSDLVATTWNVVALKTAVWAKLDVPGEVLERANRFLDSLQLEGQPGYRRTKTGGADPQLMPFAMLARVYLGWNQNRPELSVYLQRESRTGPNVFGEFVRNYLVAYTLSQSPGGLWNRWNTAMRDHLLATQEREGDDVGSWYMVDSYGSDQGWGTRQGGRLFSTAMAALLLEVYYRYPPVK
jgi:WD40 repeat protein